MTLGLWVDGKLAHTMPVETKPSGLVYFNPYSEEQIRMLVPEGDHTLRLGFIDDPFVKTLAKEDVYKDTVNKWIDSVTFVGPFPHERREAEPQEDPGLRSEDRRRPASTRSSPRWRAARTAGR